MFPFETLFADSGYRGRNLRRAAKVLPHLDIDRQRSDQSADLWLPKRWIVERTIA